jgi:hypothetical protein
MSRDDAVGPIEEPPGSRRKRAEMDEVYKGIGCFLTLLIVGVLGASVSIFYIAGGSVGAGIGVCGLAVFGLGLAYLVLER